MDPKDAAPSLRIGVTDQRLTAPGGLIVGFHFLRQKRCRQQLRELLPHAPTRPNAYDPADVALGYVGGVLCGADTLSRVAGRQSDPAVAQVRGVEAVASQSAWFFDVFSRRTGQTLAELDGDCFQALGTNLSASVDALAVWRRSNGRADLENRIRERGDQSCGASAGANRHSNWRCGAKPTGTGGGKCWAN